MKLFLIVFAAILAAAVVIFAGIGAISRLDQWEKAKREFVAGMNNENAATNAKCDYYSAQARMWAITGPASNVDMYTQAVFKEKQESRTRMVGIQQQMIMHLQNKPFWIPLTADERRALADAKAAIETLAQPTPNTSLSQLHEDSLRAQRKLDATRTTPMQTPIEVRKAKPVTKEGGGQ